MRWALVVFFWLCGSASAGVKLDFQALPVSQFAEVVLRGLLNRDYAISDSLLQSGKRLTIYAEDVDKGRALDLVREALAGVDVDMVERSGVLWLSLKGAVVPPPDQFAAYRSAFRDPAMLEAVAQFVGVRTLAGKGENSDVLLLAGDRGRLDKALGVLADIDRQPASVEVRAAILEVTDSNGSERSFSGLLSLLGGRLGFEVGGDKLANSASVKWGGLNAILSAVKGDSRFRFVAEPRLRVSSGHKARVSVGSDVPVRGALTVTDTGTAVQSVEYRSSGVILEVEPQVFDGHVSARIVQEVSTVGKNSSSGIDSPVVQRRSAETVVDAAPGEVVILAGMDQTTESDSRGGLSFLPWDTSASRSFQRSQLLLLLEFRPVLALEL